MLDLISYHDLKANYSNFDLNIYGTLVSYPDSLSHEWKTGSFKTILNDCNVRLDAKQPAGAL